MPAARRYAEQLLAVKPMETHLPLTQLLSSIIAGMSVVYWPNVPVTQST
jgi:hypothetical protein